MAEGVKDAGAEGVIGEGAGDIEPAPDPVNAPYGYTKDKDGWRPKKRPGRGGSLKAAPDLVDEGQADDRDPDPSWHTGGGSAGKPPYEASKSDQDEVASLLALLYSVPADFLLTVDPYCFGALNDNFESVIDATLPIVCRSERVVKYITGTSGLILWIKLAVALKPVLVAGWRHHVVHSVGIELDEDTGLPVAVHTDFSAYSAA